ncbi:hypothetical protein DXA92_10000 [Agathobaculum butyriciproducens]|nr:hypothetical protein DXA94_08105 [Agathobaculum butyriciproducens]RGC60350.1 hypothetical protein DXA92_10000 [Agathobaculum butyriciproducens]
MSACQPAGDVPRQHYAEVSHELVLRLKTPWTLSSETVWTKTHRAAGRMMFAAGIIGAAGSFVPNEIAKFVLVLAPTAAATIIPTVLSWRWYRAEQQ